MNTILMSVIVLAVLGVLIGLLLGVAGKVFAVETDERVEAVRECLPGNNCGGCGYPGCDGLAEAIVKGEAEVNACPVGGAAVAAKIGEILGVSADATEKKVAYVKCSGTCDKAGSKYEYTGELDCKSAVLAPGQGDKACSYGCLGLGSCVEACQFGALEIKDGIAQVNPEACVACGKCVEACPKNLIDLIPYKRSYVVACASQDKGKDVMAVCKAGCIGCGICAKQCHFDAITIENNLAVIDPDKCKGCSLCAQKCPKQVIQKVLV
ncbi:MAG: RnfABCDGE type electron transport complex subunit B [Eubacterium sp.]|nr:RnfABCDGE type electron transport complex subunit B [Eubacterium sp.]